MQEYLIGSLVYGNKPKAPPNASWKRKGAFFLKGVCLLYVLYLHLVVKECVFTTGQICFHFFWGLQQMEVKGPKNHGHTLSNHES